MVLSMVLILPAKVPFFLLIWDNVIIEQPLPRILLKYEGKGSGERQRKGEKGGEGERERKKAKTVANVETTER